MAKFSAGETTTLRKVQIGIDRGKTQETVEHLRRDRDATSGAEETRLLEEGDSVVLVGGHDWGWFRSDESSSHRLSFIPWRTPRAKGMGTLINQSKTYSSKEFPASRVHKMGSLGDSHDWGFPMKHSLEAMLKLQDETYTGQIAMHRKALRREATHTGKHSTQEGIATRGGIKGRGQTPIVFTFDLL
jgi:hypothetical protein